MANMNNIPSKLDKLEAFVEISNALTKISQIADESINTGKPITINDLSPYFTDDATWIFTDPDNNSTTWSMSQYFTLFLIQTHLY